MKLWVSSLGTLQKKEQQQYGAWMCATIDRFQAPHVVKNKEDYIEKHLNLTVSAS